MRILVVADDPDYRLVLRLALAGHPGFEIVAEAADGSEAVAAAGRCAPDVVLLDCSLRDGDAFERLFELRRDAPEARVVLLSGHDPADLRLATEATGACGFLAKETPARRLAEELSALVGLVDAVQAVLDEARLELGRDAATPRAARNFVRDALARWPVDADLEDLTDSVTLLVSELVTNAVVHAGSDVEVLVRLTAGAAHVEVSDRSEGRVAPRDAAEDDTSGRGLALVEAMSRRWGVRPRSDGGKTVWFEIERN